MFKRAVCLHFCDKEYTEAIDHETSIITSLSLKKIINRISDSVIKEKIKSLPYGTLFSRDIKSNKVYVSLPFFSSHLKLPIKEGEHVWIYEEKNEFNSTNSIANSYWLSRVHGLFFSEDTNYTYNIRDRVLSIEKILNAKENDQLNEYFVSLPTNNNYENITRLDKDTETNVPRFFGSQNDLSLQGSNNTLISMSNSGSNNGQYSYSDSKEGKILIVAGRGSCFKSYESDLNETIKTKTLSKLNDFSDDFVESKIRRITSEESTNSNGVINNLNQEENFKLPSLLTNDLFNSIERNLKEGAPYLQYDASTIIVSENEDRDDFVESKQFTIENIDFTEILKDINSSKDNLKIENSLSTKKTSGVICKRKANQYVTSENPLICLYSSDINIISRRQSDVSKTKNDGSIYLIKDSKNIENYGEISIRENGNIAINGNKILIGDFSREENKVSGEGSTVIIGKGGELNSVVLGEKLVSLLCEIIEINKESLRLLSSSLKQTSSNFNNCNDNFNSIFNWSNSHNHLHPQGPTTGLVPGTENQSPVLLEMTEIDKGFQGIMEKGKEPKLQHKLDDLIIKMDNILSKFAKTS